MSRLFLDSSVLFSAAYSTRGHAHDLIRMAIRRELTAVVSPLVLTETRRNLADNAPEHLILLDYVLQNVPFEIVQPTRREVVAATKYAALKDAPIVAAARRARVDFLVTLDKKHLLGRSELAKYTRAEIVTPKEAVIHLTRMN